jgi:hypothetical protein
MEKPPFYYYKAWWTDEPVLKLTPHWNHKDGEKVTVAVFTNCEEITLFLNGRAIETRRVERFDAPMFEVAFESGVLSVEGKCNGVMLRDEIVTSGEAREVRCTCEWSADSEADIAIYEITAHDENGVFCPLASNEIAITVENGEIVGVGNGDPSSYDYERKNKAEKNEIIPTFNDGNEVYSIPTKRSNALVPRTDGFRFETKTEGYEDDLRIVARFATSHPQDMTKTFVTTRMLAEDYEYIEFERLSGAARVYLNGEFIGDNTRWHGRQTRTSNRPYRFYGDFKKGENEIRVEFKYEPYDLPLVSGEVKIGKLVDEPWHIKLHYGKARVFVKSKTPKQLRMSFNVK